ncbi:DUF3027 domain-containing protein [Arthrobacter sp. 7Tela_A1]|uniref:DUF3027 domain-containing protein n=1 Tax=Arthrobacter sp. 7Tela_A1 TaxID=3093745 RepID=UPI003BB58F93
MNTTDTFVPEEEPKKTAARKPQRRPSKPDAVLAAAVETARAGLLEVVPEAQLGEWIGAVPEADRLVTHRFQAHRPGYRGWQWYATVARVPRGKAATVCEVGLLPSEDSVLAPEWVPWSERLRPEDVAAQAEEKAEEKAGKRAENAAYGDGEAQPGTAAEAQEKAVEPEEDAAGGAAAMEDE